MVDAKQVAGMVERYEGAVSPINGLEGSYVVLNGDATLHYLVRIDAEHECCCCPDHQHLQQDAEILC